MKHSTLSIVTGEGRGTIQKVQQEEVQISPVPELSFSSFFFFKEYRQAVRGSIHSSQ
jgi:hypothetical protein